MGTLDEIPEISFQYLNIATIYFTERYLFYKTNLSIAVFYKNFLPPIVSRIR